MFFCLLCYLENFFDGGDAVDGFENAVLGHGDHTLFDGDVLHFVFRDIAGENDFFDVFGHGENFVDTHAAFVTRVVAGFTTCTFEEFEIVEIGRVAGVRGEF